MEYDYKKICRELTASLPPRQKEVVLRRFALRPKQKEKETLEAVGGFFGVTRERARQIEEEGLKAVRLKLGKYEAVFKNFESYFLRLGGLREEEAALFDLGGADSKNQVNFLLAVNGKFQKNKESEDFYSFWSADADSFAKAKNLISGLCFSFEKGGNPLTLEELKKLAGTEKFSDKVFSSYVGISKKIQKSKEGLWGLRYWPEINPRGIKDKIYLAFKKEQKPLHFTQISNLIEGSLVQTVHNELIRDPRFVLIGRGIYALKDWGYQPGEVKDVILRIFNDEKKPLSRDEILDRVLKQRQIKETTVFLNLSDKKYFSRDSLGRYFVNEI